MNYLYLYLFLLTIFIVIFPFSTYYIFIENNKSLNKLNQKFYLEITFTIIILLIINIYLKYNLEIYLLFISIPIIINIQIMQNNIYLFTILIISVLFLYIKNYLILLIIINFIPIKYIKKTKKEIIYIIIYTLILITYYIINKNNINLFLLIIYFTTLFVSSLYIKLLKERINTLNTLKNIEDEKLFKTSIFKVTHEIKNPLSVIKGYLSIFDCKDYKKSERYKSILIKEVENTLEVLKDFSEVNNLKIEKKLMNISELLVETNNSLKGFYNKKNINISIVCEKKLLINADFNRLKQVLINILKNSIEALDNNGNIYIKSYLLNNKVKIEIKDDGCGMDEKTLENIFVPFYTKKTYGSGLGLNLSKEIIEKHNGSIKYYSKLNCFTLVEIFLPIH